MLIKDVNSASLCLSASYNTSDSGSGLVDQLLNSRRVRDAPNILILHVTSFPFALQTQYTRISPYNEIHWPSAFSNVRLLSAFGTMTCVCSIYLDINTNN